MDHKGNSEAQRLRPHIILIKVTDRAAHIRVHGTVLTSACPGHKSNSAVKSKQLRHNVHCSALLQVTDYTFRIPPLWRKGVVSRVQSQWSTNVTSYKSTIPLHALTVGRPGSTYSLTPDPSGKSGGFRLVRT